MSLETVDNWMSELSRQLEEERRKEKKRMTIWVSALERIGKSTTQKISKAKNSQNPWKRHVLKRMDEAARTEFQRVSIFNELLLGSEP